MSQGKIFLPSLFIDYKTNTLKSTISPYIPLFVTSFAYFQIIAFSMIILLIPLYPLPFSLKWYFKKRGFIRAVKEYEFVKIVLYISVPLLLLFTFIVILDPTEQNIQNNSIMQYYILIIHPHLSSIDNMKNLFFIIVTAAILKILFARIRKEFWLYYARGCFVQMQSAINDVDEMSYFVRGLDAYNLYLRKKIKLEIKDLNQIYSKISSFDDLQKNNVIGKFALFFFPDYLVDTITLYPLKTISTLLNLSDKEILYKQSFKDELKELGTILTLFITLFINVITFIITSLFNHK